MDGPDPVNFEADLDVMASPDVAVAGGGIAGVSAAVAAARQGTEVLLIERYNALGGTATIAGVGSFCGETAGQGEVFDDIVAGLDDLGVIADYRPYPEMEARTFDHQWLKIVLLDLCEEAGVRVLLHSTVVATRADEGRVSDLVVAYKGGLGVVQAAVVVDATGDADVVAQAGLGVEKGNPQLAMGYMLFTRYADEGVKMPLPEGWRRYENSDELPKTSVWSEPYKKAGIKSKMVGYDATDPWDLTAAEIEAARKSLSQLEFLSRERLSGYVLDHFPGQVGIREGRRIVGREKLTEADIRAGRRFDDAVARGTFYIDFHDPHSDRAGYAVKQEQVPPYDIRYGCLVPQGAHNILAAGRCLSSDQVANSSARVMTSCAMMGQAAGIAAAWAAERDAAVRDIDEKELRTALIDRGAELD
ncbi:MAG: FAD-dependent oxidoreductase [Armatimonadota bacterium]